MAAGQGFKTFATGDILTAADTNGYLMSQTVMVFADSSARSTAITSPQQGMVTFLKGTNSTEYYNGSAWVAISASASSFSGVSLTKSAAQSISNATTTTITWDVEDYDTDNFHSTSSNTDRITIPAGKAGKYLIQARVSTVANASGIRSAGVQKNGSTAIVNMDLNNQSSGADSVLILDKTITASVGDYFNVFLYQTSGGSLNTESSNISAYMFFQMTYLGA